MDPLLAEYTARWERGESPSIEEYVARLGPASGDNAAALIYHAFCLAETSGLNPKPADYLDRFPLQSRSLQRLFDLHRAFSTSQFPALV